jgi:hypothetical protein
MNILNPRLDQPTPIDHLSLAEHRPRRSPKSTREKERLT